MSNELRYRYGSEPATGAVRDGDSTERVASLRARVDGIVAVANEAFARVRAMNSEDFVGRSRQTGGQ